MSAKVVLKNKNDFNKATREDVKKWCGHRQYAIGKAATLVARRNVPPTKRKWPANTEYKNYRPKGRLKRNIRHDKRSKRRAGNQISMTMGVGRRGHARHSAAIHEFGRVITTPGGRMMKFKGPGRKWPTVTNRVVILRKRYLRDGIVRSLNTYANNVQVPYL